MNIKQLLSETMPEDVTLSEREKAAIRQRIHVNKKPSPLRFFAPIVAASVLLLALILFIPTLTQDQQPAFEIERSIVFPDFPYQSSLMAATYIEQNDEMIFTAEDGIYSYSFEDAASTKLFDTSKRIYDYVASEKWIIWVESMEDERVLSIVNRETGKQNMLQGGSWHSLTLQDNRLLYYAVNVNEEPGHWMMELTTLTESILHRSAEGSNGSSSKPARGEGMTAISERTDDSATIYIYEDASGELVRSFTSPYPAIHNLRIDQGRVYGDFASEEGHMRLGYITIADGQYVEVNTPDFRSSFVSGEYVVLDVLDKRGWDTTDAELFRIKDSESIPVTDFPSIKERLIIPRLVKQGPIILIEENYINGGPTLHFVKP